MLGIHAARARPVRGWPCRGFSERHKSGEAIVSFGDGYLDQKAKSDNDARVWLYLKLRPYPLSHSPRGSIGWDWHGKSGPLNFGSAAMAVADGYLD